MDNYKFVIPYAVRVVDVNYGGHVANSAVLNFFQDGRIAYLKHLGGWSEMNIGNGCGVILPEAHVKYYAEMFLGDELEIGVRVEKLGRSSLTMAYRIERQGQAVAEGTTVLVCFDYSTRKPRRIGDAFREAVVDFEGLSNE